MSRPLTENELEMLRIRCQVIALETIVGSFVGALYRTSSTDGKALLLAKLDGLPRSLDLVRIPEAGPEFSDLFAAELRDAGESLVSFLKSRLDE